MAEVAITQAPRFIVLRPKADGTLTTGGDSSGIAAAVVVSRKGKPGVPLSVTGETMVNTLGRPLPMSDGSDAEGMRHLDEALKVCASAYVVRAVADDARYPAIVINKDGTQVQSNHSFNSEISLGANALMAFYVKDGDVDSERSIEIVNARTGDGTFDLVVKQKTGTEWLTIGTYEDLSVDIDGTNDLDMPSFAETALDGVSPYVGCIVSRDALMTDIADVSTVEFAGGTSGGDVTAQNVIDAWNVLKYSNLPFNLGMAAGQYDHTVIKHIDEICDSLMIQFRYDIPPHLTDEQGKDWLIALSLGNSYAASAYHYPYKADDKWSGGKAVWGISGVATAAKARCFATTDKRPDVPGVHYAAAGQTRGSVGRTGVEPLHVTGFINDEDKVEVRDASGDIVGRYNPTRMGRYIDDSLTCFAKKNYLRFEWVVAIYFAMAHEVREGAESLKHEPDGITRESLERVCGRIGQKYTDSGALVAPRQPDIDGEDPFIFKIEQVEIDLWSVEMSICPTGSFRRGSLQPIIMR